MPARSGYFRIQRETLEDILAQVHSVETHLGTRGEVLDLEGSTEYHAFSEDELIPLLARLQRVHQTITQMMEPAAKGSRGQVVQAA